MPTALLFGSAFLSQPGGEVRPGEIPPGAASWVRVAEHAAFSPRDTAEGVAFDGKLWLSNGYYHGNVLTRDLWCSPDGAEWTLVNDSTPYDGYSEMVVHDGKMWAIKGSVWHSTDGIDWTKALDETPFGARGYGEVVLHQGKMWQLGSGEDVWTSTDGVNWTCVNQHAGYGSRSASAVAVFSGKLWLMGGRISQPNDPPEKGYDTMTTYNDVWCSVDGVQWECVMEAAPWAPRMWVIPAVYAGRMWIIGGYDNVNSRNLGDVWYTNDGTTWHELAAEPTFSPRHESTCYAWQNSLWVVAGNSWPVQDDVWRLTLPTNQHEG